MRRGWRRSLVAVALACGTQSNLWAQMPALRKPEAISKGGTQPAQAAASGGSRLVDPLTGLVHSQRLLSGVPLGGIGTGTFQLFTDGTIGQIALQDPLAPPLAGAPACFAALWTETDNRTGAQVLALSNAYGLPSASKLDYQGLFPQANLSFPDPKSPVQISYTAFSPIIPFDLQNSSFPAVAYILHVKNSGAAPIDVSVALSWENLLQANTPRSTQGRASIIPSGGGYFGAIFAPATSEKSEAKRAMCLLAYPNRTRTQVTTALWDASSKPAWWETFAREGTVGESGNDQSGKPANGARNEGVSLDSTRPAAVVAMRVTLKPGELIDLPFAISWYTASNRPGSSGGRSEARSERVKEESQHDPYSGEPGHYYEAAFADAEDAGRRLLADWRSLYGLTEEWQKRLLFSNLPYWVASRMINAAAPLATNTIHTRDGRFTLFNRPDPARSGTEDQGAPVEARADAERRDTRSHEAVQSLLLALYPQLAAQELIQLGRLQDSRGLLPPPASANYLARLGLPVSSLEALKQDTAATPSRSSTRPLPKKSVSSPPHRSGTEGSRSIPGNKKGSADNKRATVGATVPAPDTQPPVVSATMPQMPIVPPAETPHDPLDSTAAYLIAFTRFALWIDDREFLTRQYPIVQRAARALIDLRGNRPLPPDSLSHWIVALRATERLARQIQDTALERACAEAANKGVAQMETSLWNGSFYSLHTDTDLPVCASDQLWGQGLAYQLGIGPLFSTEHLQKAWGSIQRLNDKYTPQTETSTKSASALTILPFLPFSWRVRADGQSLSSPLSERCLVPATLIGDISLGFWQNQPEVALQQMLHLEAYRAERLATPWQYPTLLDPTSPVSSRLAAGITAPTATPSSPDRSNLARQAEKEKEKEKEKNAGEGGTPSAMTRFADLMSVGTLAVGSDWNLLYALAGFGWDDRGGELTLTPRLPGYWQTFRVPVFAPTFWGRLEYRPSAHGGTLTFRLDRLMGFQAHATPSTTSLTNRAELTIRSLRLPGPPAIPDALPFTAHASHGRNPIGSRVVRNTDGTVTLTFDTPLVMTAGDRMQVEIH